MSEHTPEPWVFVERRAWAGIGEGERHYDLEADNRPLGIIYGDNAVWLEKEAGEGANARRIVACVNACKGWPTDYLESWAADPTSPLRDHLLNQIEATVIGLRVALLHAHLRTHPHSPNACDGCVEVEAAMSTMGAK